MDPEAPPTVIVPARTFEQIEDAIRVYHIVTFHKGTADAGLQNILVWPTPWEDDTIMLIKGES